MIEAAEHDRRAARPVHHFGDTVRRLVGEAAPRQAPDLLHRSFHGVVRRERVVRDPVVDAPESGGREIAKIRGLYRRRLEGKDPQPTVRRVPGQVHQDVDAILIDLSRDVLVALAHRRSPVVRLTLDALRHDVGFGDLRITVHLDMATVVPLEQRFEKVAHGMAFEIRRDVAHLEPLIRILHAPMAESLATSLAATESVVPLEMSVQRLLRRCQYAITQCEEEVAVRRHRFRLERHRALVVDARLPDVAGPQMEIAQVVVGHRPIGPQA